MVTLPPLLPLVALLIGRGVANVLPSLRSTHSALQTAEELHRAFKLERDVDMPSVTVNEGVICADWTRGTTTSRQQFEQHWLMVWEAGYLDSVYNGSCFATSIDTCTTFTQCEEAARQYPQQQDLSGTLFFAPDADAKLGIQWAGSHAAVEAETTEQAYLLEDLTAAPDEASSRAIYIRNAITAAANEADLYLRTDAKSLLMMLTPRVTDFKRTVSPDTAPAPVQGSSQLPTELQGLARSIEELMVAARDNPCSESLDWASLRTAVQTELGNQQVVIDGIDIAQLLQSAMFDYVRRALEALTVGTALAMQASALAVLAEFGCLTQTDPRAATVTSMTPLLSAAQALMVAVTTAVPTPSDGSQASAGLQQCLATRLAAVQNAVATASTEWQTLLPLDTCGRLFDAATHQLVTVAPGTEQPLPAVSMEFFAGSGEERLVHGSSSSDLALVSPFANFLQRQGSEANLQFSAGDYVLQLSKIDNSNIRVAGTMPADNACSIAEIAALEVYARDFCSTPIDGSQCAPGCYASIGRCLLAGPGFYAVDGAEFECPLDVSQYGKAAPLGYGWPNASCPWVCDSTDEFWTGTECRSCLIGTYSPKCSNEVSSCSTPATMPASLFRTIVQFTTPGFGDPLGCEATLAFPVALDTPLAELLPPFTIELFARTSVSELPISDEVQPGLGYLAGSFGEWFVALRRASSTAVHISFYHAKVTRAEPPAARRDSILDSAAFTWGDEAQHHIAVVVTSMHAFVPNVFFYVDGVLVSQAQRQGIAGALPPIAPEFLRKLHVGPPNMNLFPEVLASGRTEPYFNLSSNDRHFRAQVDEVRVHGAALDPRSLGSHWTERRRSTACDTPAERLDGNACRPASRLTSQRAVADQSECQDGFEPCSSQPGMCVAKCLYGTFRQADCSCDCQPGQFQTWRIQAVHFSGFGSVQAVRIYDQTMMEVARKDNFVLPLRLALGFVRQVALITVLGSTAQTVSIKVETGTGEQFTIPEYASVPLRTDREAVLHHRRIHPYFDDTVACSACPGGWQSALGSRSPRMDATSCDCVDGYGRDLLGKCQPRRAPLTAPSMSLAAGSHSAGTQVSLCASIQSGSCSANPVEEGTMEGPWLTEVRYTTSTGGTPQVPTCASAALYTEPLDLIRPRETVTICAVVCHPLHYDSNSTCVSYTGNDHMHPPRCEASGTQSTPTTYALTVSVSIMMDSQPDATIYYQVNGGVTQLYSSAIALTTQGQTTVQTWAEKVGFDTSYTTVCQFSVDGAARAQVVMGWPTDDRPIGGFAYAEEAHIVQLGATALRPVLTAQVLGNPLQNTDSFEIECRISHARLTHLNTAVSISGWQEVPSNGSVSMPIADILWDVGVSTLAHLEWRVKEVGYVWSNPAGAKFVLFATQTSSPAIEAVADEPWGIGDHWSPGPAREAALRQVHRVELRAPTTRSQLLFVIGQLSADLQLLQASEVNVSSALDSGSLTELYQQQLPSVSWGPDTLPEHCAADAGGDEAQRLCSYLGPFKVLAGTTITAFALDDAELQSVPTVFTVPIESEPAKGDAMFEAAVRPVSRTLALSADNRVMVLPSVATNLQFSLGQDGLPRQSCVLASAYSHMTGSPTGTLTHANCSWVEYQGSRRFELQSLLDGLHAGASDSQISLNVSVLTTMKQSGYLWSHPSVWNFLWLRERARSPNIVSVVAPGVVGRPAAMVWVQSESAPGSGLDFGEPVQGVGTQEECYFTVHHVALQAADVPPNSFMAVPDVNNQGLTSIRQAMQRTSTLIDAPAVETWLDAVRGHCQWPAICHLPLTGTLPAELVIPPADLPYVCAWSTWPGYTESHPTCERIEATSVTEVRPDFSSDSSDASGQALAVTELGFDAGLGASIILLDAAQDVSRRMIEEESTSVGTDQEGQRPRALAATAGLELAINREHPVQYRFFSRSVTPAELEAGIGPLLADSSFGAWHQLSIDAPAPVVPGPAPGDAWPAEHALFAVDVRLLVGIDRWSQPSRTLALLLEGRHPTLQTRMVGRTVTVEGMLPSSTVLFRWSLGGVDEPRAVDGGPVYRRQSVTTPDVHLLPGQLYGLEAGVQAQLQPDDASGLACAPPEEGVATPDEIDRETRFGPRLCRRVISGGATVSLQLEAPDHRHWGLWVTAYASGLNQSLSTEAILEATCAAPAGIAFAASAPCLQGASVLSGTVCTAQCASGYTASHATLACSDGVLQPASFVCQENPCTMPTPTGNQSRPPCLEGSVIEGGKRCTTSCDPGFDATVPTLQCTRGSLSPSNFQCEKPEVVVPQASGSDDSSIAAPLIISLTCILALVAVTVSALVIIKRPELIFGKPQAPGPSDPLLDWWECIQGIDPTMCVFCNREPHSQGGWETNHGPPTIYRCCATCWQVLEPNSSMEPAGSKYGCEMPSAEDGRNTHASAYDLVYGSGNGAVEAKVVGVSRLPEVEQTRQPSIRSGRAKGRAQNKRARQPPPSASPSPNHEVEHLLDDADKRMGPTPSGERGGNGMTAPFDSSERGGGGRLSRQLDRRRMAKDSEQPPTMYGNGAY